MCVRAVHRHIFLAVFYRPLFRRLRANSLRDADSASRLSQQKFICSPSRRPQEGSKDNATLRLDSSLETPDSEFPPLFVPVVRTGALAY